MPHQSKSIDIHGVQKALAGEESVLAAYLAGSQASGLTHSESDVDIAILLKNADRLREQYTDTYLKFYSLLAPYTESVTDKRDLDILLLQALSLAHQFHAIHQGELIYYRDPEQVLDYEEHIGNLYADMQPQMNEILGEYIHHIAHV